MNLEPVDPTSYECLDCGAKGDETGCAQHDVTCPTGTAIDAATDADRQWFEDHPFATYRVRRAAPREADALLSVPVNGDVICRVTQLQPGVRTREFYVRTSE